MHRLLRRGASEYIREGSELLGSLCKPPISGLPSGRPLPRDNDGREKLGRPDSRLVKSSSALLIFIIIRMTD